MWPHLSLQHDRLQTIREAFIWSKPLRYAKSNSGWSQCWPQICQHQKVVIIVREIGMPRSTQTNVYQPLLFGRQHVRICTEHFASWGTLLLFTTVHGSICLSPRSGFGLLFYLCELLMVAQCAHAKPGSSQVHRNGGTSSRSLFEGHHTAARIPS